MHGDFSGYRIGLTGGFASVVKDQASVSGLGLVRHSCSHFHGYFKPSSNCSACKQRIKRVKFCFSLRFRILRARELQKQSEKQIPAMRLVKLT